jgi:hypothetical protein
MQNAFFTSQNLPQIYFIFFMCLKKRDRNRETIEIERQKDKEEKKNLFF